MLRNKGCFRSVWTSSNLRNKGSGSKYSQVDPVKYPCETKGWLVRIKSIIRIYDTSANVQLHTNSSDEYTTTMLQIIG